MPVGVVYEWGSHTQGDPVTLDALSGVPIVAIDSGYENGVVIDSHQLHFLKGALGGGNSLSPRADASAAACSNLAGMIQAAFGHEHTLVLSKDGRVYSWGKGWEGQLGLGSKILETPIPTELRYLQGKKVKGIATGSHHSAAVTEDGTLYTWGRGFEGQTGHSSKALSEVTNVNITGVQLLPKSVGAFAKHRVAMVSCGHQFTSAMTTLGEIWAWGEGQLGQLGLGRCTCRRVPELVLRKCDKHRDGGLFTSVSCGWAHTLAVATCNCLFSWGFNNFGQLGLGDTETRFYPDRVTLPSTDETAPRTVFKVTSARAGGNISMATSFSLEELYTWGFGQDGRLGHGLPAVLQTKSRDALLEVSHRRRNSELKLRRLASSLSRVADIPEELPPAVLYETSPHQVMALEGKKVTAFSVFKGGALAFVSSACYSVAPPLGPLSGGTTLSITGGGFWNSTEIVVRFSPRPQPVDTPEGAGVLTTPNVVPRSSVGKFVGIDPVSKNQIITCRTPKFAVPGEVLVEVAVNGKDFTESKKIFTFYIPPEFEELTVKHADARIPKEIKIKGVNVFETGSVKVKFKLKGSGQENEFVVEGKVVQETRTLEGAEQEEDDELTETFVVANTPIVKGTTPLDAKVSVALNGSSFVSVPGPDFVFHRAEIYSIHPKSCPLIPNMRIEFHGQELSICSKVGATARFFCARCSRC